jgi:hypothetical protein
MALTFPSSPAVDSTYTASGSTWIWTGTAWDLVRIAAGPSGPSGPAGPSPAFSIVQTTPPLSPEPGQAWYNSTDGLTYIYYDSAWIEFGNSLAGPTGPSGPSGPSGASGPSGPSGASSLSMIGWTPIQTLTPTSGTAISFTNLGTYNNFMLTWQIVTSTHNHLYFTFNNESTGTNYQHEYHYVNGANGYPYMSSFGFKTSLAPYTYLITGAISLGYGSLYLYGGKSSTSGKAYHINGTGFTGAVGSGSNTLSETNGYWNNMDPVTSIQVFLDSASTFGSGNSFTLYGSTS